MKQFQRVASTVLGVVIAFAARGQGTFQNLNFEAANVQQTQSSGLVNTTDALPGWIVYYGSNQQSQIYNNEPSAGSSRVALLGTNGFGIYRSIEGGFSALLQGGVTDPDASIRQTGVVPVTAQSIQFKAQADFGTLLVSLGGQDIPYFPISSGPNYTLYGGDITAFAGQTAELSFSALHAPPAGRNNWNLDSILFSSQPIPEPSTLGVFTLGALLLGWRLRMTRKP